MVQANLKNPARAIRAAQVQAAAQARAWADQTVPVPGRARVVQVRISKAARECNCERNLVDYAGDDDKQADIACFLFVLASPADDAVSRFAQFSVLPLS